MMDTTDTAEAHVLPQATSTAENAAPVRRFYDEIFNRGNLAAAEDLIASS